MVTSPRLPITMMRPFDEFYGIPLDTSWNDAVTVPLICCRTRLTRLRQI
jgi:hypothetical protein